LPPSSRSSSLFCIEDRNLLLLTYVCGIRLVVAPFRIGGGQSFFMHIIYSKTRQETGSYKYVLMLFSLCNILYSTAEFVAKPISPSFMYLSILKTMNILKVFHLSTLINNIVRTITCNLFKLHIVFFMISENYECRFKLILF
uniref:Pecanex-like protein n=1 Tax=Angiostrongylus costaricensis TaxID=334426 RepID=A0A0R3Q2G6_ANGCS